MILKHIGFNILAEDFFSKYGYFMYDFIASKAVPVDLPPRNPQLRKIMKLESQGSGLKTETRARAWIIYKERAW